MAHATVGNSVTVHNNCIINSGAIMSHDCILHDNVHIAPGSHPGRRSGGRQKLSHRNGMHDLLERPSANMSSFKRMRHQDVQAIP